MKTVNLDLESMGACDPAVAWFDSYNWWSLEQAWCACEDGSWMLWICGRLGLDRMLIVCASCEIARTVLHSVPNGENRPRLAIEAAEAWCKSPNAAELAAASAAADDASAAAYANGDRVHSLRQSADIVRAIVPYDAVVSLLGSAK